MGGIGYGLKSSEIINPINPASFSNVDSMSFMIDMGISARLGWFSDEDRTVRKFNGNIEYLAMQFPLSKTLGMGLGLKQISSVGYDYGNISGTGQSAVVHTYSGSGGLSEVYGGISYKLFKGFSLGANIGYLFGDLKHGSKVGYYDVENFTDEYIDTLRVNGLDYELGFQYTYPLSKGKQITIGGVFSPKRSVGGKYMESYVQRNISNSVVERKDSTTYNLGLEMPTTIGIGFTYNEMDRLTLGADFTMEAWESATFYGDTDKFRNSNKFSLGGEYIPQYKSRKFLERVRYRFGAKHSNSYVLVNNSGYKEYGVSLGFGLPMNDGRSLLNTSFEFTKVSPESKQLVGEQYFKFTFSYTFNELWFFQRKVQ
ncbi:membrane protein [Bacteroidales bacterium]|nr:membrane protein [Bacteroidales bacterium]